MTAAASPFRCVLDVKASLGECPVWSAAEQVLYWVDINAPSLNRFDPATGAQRVMPMPESIGCFALRARRRLRRRAARRRLARRRATARSSARSPTRRTIPRTIASTTAAAIRRDASRRHDERAARRRHGGALPPRSRFRADARARRHHDQQRPRVESRRAHDVPRRHADARHHARTTTTPRPGRRRGRARSRASPRETDRPDGAAVDSDGLLLDRALPRRQGASVAPDGRTLREFPVPAMCPTMCAFGGPDLRTLYVTSARQLRDADELARLPQSGGIFAMARRRAGPARAASPADPDREHAMHFDPTAFLRLDAPQASARRRPARRSRRRPATSSRCRCYGPGVFRLRVGPNTRPDYGLVVGRVKACTVAQPATGAPGRSPPATATLELAGRAAARSGCCIRARRCWVDHRRALPRLDATAGVRSRAPGRPLDRGVRARVGRARVRPRREIRPARQARAADPFAGRRRARRQHRALVQEHAVRLEPGHRQRRVGRVRQHAGASRTASGTPTGRTAGT